MDADGGRFRASALRTRITHLDEPHDSALLPKGTLFLVPAVKRSVVGCADVLGAAWKAIQSTPRHDDFAQNSVAHAHKLIAKCVLRGHCSTSDH